jgi:3-oxoacyl-[acyl-carrier protein] reductase
MKAKLKPGKTAIVTGASRKIGIAAAVARALARDGWNIVTTCWRPYDATMPWGSRTHEAEALIAELKRLGMRAMLYEDNLEDPASAKRIFDAAESEIGPVSALVNAHAHSTHGGLMDTTVADFDRHIAVNARGVFITSAEFARRFKGPAGAGRIVNFTSGLPLKGEIAYAASKGAIEWITVSSAAELAPRGITVNAINPGPNDTGWMKPRLRKQIAARSPMGRIGRPDDAANVVAFVCSPAAGWLTGQIIQCDGGWSTILRD